MDKILSFVAERLEGPPVAFYAHHLSDLKLDETNEILVFEKTFINDRTSYNTTTGIFTAPIGGMYEFVVHICAYINRHSNVALVWENVVIASHGHGSKEDHSCTTVGAIVLMKSGEQVWVKSSWRDSRNQLFQNVNRMNTFRGMMIK